MLRAAGVPVEIRAAGVDEAAVRDSMKAEGASTADTATAPAGARGASCPWELSPSAFVIGADQMLEDWWCVRLRRRRIGTGRPAPRFGLWRGRDHTLVSGAIVVRGRARIWHHSDKTRMTVRPFSDAFLDQYLDAAGRTFSTPSAATTWRV